MNKKILLISSVLLTLILITIVIFNNEDNSNNIISNIKKEEPVINSNMITMMYETEAGSGEYTETLDNTWPEKGYIFNDTLSGCENGGELEYNSQNNTVNLLSNSSDKCYVYFDKYDGVWIDNVSITNVTSSSITLVVDATSENGNITTYYYALNDSEEYIESTSNPIVINDLNKLTEYKISIYTIDSTNAKSNIYEISVNTTDESKPVINSVIANNITNNSITLTIDATSDVGIKRYYYIIENTNYGIIIANNSYTFENLEDDTTYNFVLYAIDNNDISSKKYKISINTDNITNFSNYIRYVIYSGDGLNGLYYHDGYGSYANADLEAGDNSYRFAGEDPNNYVCFGTNDTICSENNLYRIIGVFDTGEEYQVKLIKDNSVTQIKWNTVNNSDWASSNVNNYLNNDFLLNLYNFSDYISYHKWKVGILNLNDELFLSKNVFVNEILNNTNVYNAKIGLMYISDYAYSAIPSFWSKTMDGMGGYGIASNDNWIMANISEWLITSYDKYSSYTIFEMGNISAYNTSNTVYIRPTFYLNSFVQFAGGNGSKSTPFRLKI